MQGPHEYAMSRQTSIIMEIDGSATCPLNLKAESTVEDCHLLDQKGAQARVGRI